MLTLCYFWSVVHSIKQVFTPCVYNKWTESFFSHFEVGLTHSGKVSFSSLSLCLHSLLSADQLSTPLHRPASLFPCWPPFTLLKHRRSNRHPHTHIHRELSPTVKCCVLLETCFFVTSGSSDWSCKCLLSSLNSLVIWWAVIHCHLFCVNVTELTNHLCEDSAGL